MTFAKGGRLRLEAYGSGSLNSDREYLGELLIRALGRELDLPEVSTSGGRVRVTASQRAAMSAEVGVCQLCRGKNRVCGDCCDSFTDPSGALYVVLSDGMGSGSRYLMSSATAHTAAIMADCLRIFMGISFVLRFAKIGESLTGSHGHPVG